MLFVAAAGHNPAVVVVLAEEHNYLAEVVALDVVQADFEEKNHLVGAAE